MAFILKFPERVSIGEYMPNKRVDQGREESSLGYGKAVADARVCASDESQ